MAKGGHESGNLSTNHESVIEVLRAVAKKYILGREFIRLSAVGDRAFPTAVSLIWNSLSLYVTSALSLQTSEEETQSVFVQPQFPVLICLVS